MGTGPFHGLIGYFMVSDGLSVPEELVILVVAAEAASDVGEIGNKLDALDPLQLFEPELRFVA